MLLDLLREYLLEIMGTTVLILFVAICIVAYKDLKVNRQLNDQLFRLDKELSVQINEKLIPMSKNILELRKDLNALNHQFDKLDTKVLNMELERVKKEVERIMLFRKLFGNREDDTDETYNEDEKGATEENELPEESEMPGEKPEEENSENDTSSDETSFRYRSDMNQDTNEIGMN